MKNKRDIILDFTSLLDVIMLILFFFVIFAQLDTNETIKKTELLRNEVQKEKEEIDNKLESLNNVLRQTETQLNELQQANALAESIIINGAGDFDRALRLKLVLDGERSDWYITVMAEAEENSKIVYSNIGVISDVRRQTAYDTAKKLENMITEYGYSKEDAFICDLMYNSFGAGSRTAKDNADEMLKILQNNFGYKYLFASATDLSEMENNENEEY